MKGPSKKSKDKKVAPLPLDKCLAKTRELEDKVVPGRSVEEHCRIAGAIAREILRRNPLLAKFLPENADIPALLHDIGKLCPTFQRKLYIKITPENLPEILKTIHATLDENKLWGGHAGVSYATIKNMFKNVKLAEVAGRHHSTKIITDRSATHESYGSELWEDLREKLAVMLLTGRKIPEITSFEQLLALIGLTITADWIASGDIFDDPAQPWEDRIIEAVDAAGFKYPVPIPGLEFENIFFFPPNAMQQAFAAQVRGPGVYILEAPMGLGKTEAALYAAYRMIEQGKANGIYFALPTQFTSNRIHDRVNAFLKQILKEEVSSVLTHSNAWLARFMEQEMGLESAEEESWFEQGKRGILAPFAVGTIDQALLAVMKVKHAGLRAFGLVGKVVILDEVHSYDAYMGVIIDELVKYLQAAGCIVIILSATLSGGRKDELISAPKSAAEDRPYPLISAKTENREFLEEAIAPGQDREVKIKICPDDRDAIEEALKRAKKGQQVLWIENTVGSAQEIYRLCAASGSSCGVACGLIHSRFIQADREKKEKEWAGIYGKKSPERAKTGRILIGTQVLEQSLDLDADFLITRLAPTDMILQRIGRLWRHANRMDRNSTAKEPEAWLLAPDLAQALENPEEIFGRNAVGFNGVYHPYVLGRSLEALRGLRAIALPGQIRKLLRATYAERDSETTEGMLGARDDLKSLRNQYRGKALQNISEYGSIMSDEISSTRLTEIQRVKVLVLADWDPQTRTCTFFDGQEVSLLEKSDSKRIRAALARNSVSVPHYKAPEAPANQDLEPFKRFSYEAKSNDLRILVIGRDGVARHLSGMRLPDYSYTTTEGYKKI